MSSEELKLMPMPSLGEFIDWVWQLKEDYAALEAECEVHRNTAAGAHQQLTENRLETERLAKDWMSAVAERDALRAELEAIKGQEPVAFYWQDIGYPEPRTHGPFFGWPSEAALRNVDGGAIPVPLYTLPPAIRSPGVQASGPYASVADGLAKRYPKPSLLKDCNVSYSNSSRPLDEQGERQEAVAWIVPDFGFLFPTEDAAQRYLRNINDLRKPTALYATPQPGPDVRALVEALRSAHSAIVYRGDAVSYDDALRRIDAALAAHRQEQPQ